MLIITSLVLFTFNFLFAAFGWLAVPPGVEVNGDILRSLPKTSVVSQCDAGLVWHHFLRLSIWYKCGMLCIWAFVHLCIWAFGSCASVHLCICAFFIWVFGTYVCCCAFVHLSIWQLCICAFVHLCAEHLSIWQLCIWAVVHLSSCAFVRLCIWAFGSCAFDLNLCAVVHLCSCAFMHLCIYICICAFVQLAFWFHTPKSKLTLPTPNTKNT